MKPVCKHCGEKLELSYGEWYSGGVYPWCTAVSPPVRHEPKS